MVGSGGLERRGLGGVGLSGGMWGIGLNCCGGRWGMKVRGGVCSSNREKGLLWEKKFLQASFRPWVLRVVPYYYVLVTKLLLKSNFQKKNTKIQVKNKLA